ncbi:protoheme IX farnesyltransferase [Mariprofundus sp. NF]|uniref:heme o synthase n=1 Tax=Mariprofundus sp. NF TaxID=2608716 RepID=UPI00159F9FC2|nr:heme o synthase [Mariprofundus sp. NF]NWF38757.1 protoheme IX farnesyltransferase [Mariprofundus sp. NF]
MSQSLAEQQISTRSVISDYVSMSKPGIVGLTLVAALTGIYFGNHGVMPHWHLIGWTFLTLGLATAGSCMLNNHYDRDIDKLMKRTSNRALAAGAVSANRVFIVAMLLTTSSLALMAWTVNPLTAAVTAVGVIGYVGVYTMWMKRRTPWANQFGGIAGAVPPMVGYAAVTNELGAAGWVLFAIMVVWQQPHALALALKYREEYARANVPVIPVACGVYATKLRILLYTIALIPVAMTPWYFDIAGSIYLAASIMLSSMFLFTAVRFYRSERDSDMRVFAFSIIYLILLFGIMIIDSI